MPINVRHASLKETLVEAKKRSALTNEQIASRSGLDHASVARYFSLYDSYEPSASKIPPLCRALGNTVLVDWLNAQVEDLRPEAQPIVTASQVAQVALKNGQMCGELSAAAAEVIADGHVSPAEARQMQAHHRDREAFHRSQSAAYEPLARMSDEEFRAEGAAPLGYIVGQKITPTGFKNVLVPNETVERKQ